VAGFGSTMPLPVTSDHRPPPLCEPRGGSSPLIRIRGFRRTRGTREDKGARAEMTGPAKLVGVDAHDFAVLMVVFERLEDRRRGMYLRDHHEGD
jgi:hypothetical protein